ncbi:nicotinamidase-related amidase [Rhizobium sp. RAS22]|nr:nicotinamidase-related amidase [Rhizobium sp. RAS22]
MHDAHDFGYDTNVIYDASAGYTRKQQDDFVAEIAPSTPTLSPRRNSWCRDNSTPARLVHSRALS